MKDFDPERIFIQLEEAGNYWADAQAAAEIYEENKKTVLADLMSEHGGSNVERERIALSSDKYKRHLENMVAARKEANKARVRYDSFKVLAEMRRTQESTRRAEASIR